MTTKIDKLNEENDDKYNRMNEKITTMEKRMTMLEDPNNIGSGTKTNDTEGNNSEEDQNKKGAVVTGFHDDTTEQEVQDVLGEITTTIEMPIDQIQIKCPAKPITHAFLQFKDNDERDKFVRSANILNKELRGRKMKISLIVTFRVAYHCVCERKLMNMKRIQRKTKRAAAAAEKNVMVAAKRRQNMLKAKAQEAAAPMQTNGSKKVEKTLPSSFSERT